MLYIDSMHNLNKYILHLFGYLLRDICIKISFIVQISIFISVCVIYCSSNSVILIDSFKLALITYYYNG